MMIAGLTLDEFFITLPFNSSQVYSENHLPSGCKLYVPARTTQEAEFNRDFLKEELGEYVPEELPPLIA